MATTIWHHTFSPGETIDIDGPCKIVVGKRASKAAFHLDESVKKTVQRANTLERLREVVRRTTLTRRKR